MSDFVIMCAESHFPWTLAATQEAAETKLAALKLESPERWESGRILTFDAYQIEHDARYLDQPARIIDAEEWEDMLGVLPPLQWHTTPDGVNVFCMSEFTSGRITTQYGRRNGQYRAKAVRFRDVKTYLTASDFDA